jgi:hypothetical protein
MLLVIVLSGAIAGWRAYTSLTPYDDEGTLMSSVRQFEDGGVLYDKVPSIYGPVYYLYESIPHLITGAPVSHDSVRLVTAILRVAVGLVFFLLIYRATGSLVCALVGHYVGFRACAFMGMETAHPQEICILLLLALLLASCARRPSAIAWFGILCASMALSKINLGIFATAAVAVVLVPALPRGRVQRMVTAITTAGVLALPFALMRAHLDQPATLWCAVTISFSIAAAILAARTNQIHTVRWRDIGIGVLSAFAAAILIASFVMARGTTIGGMIQSLVVLPGTRFVQTINQPLAVGIGAVLWAAMNLVLAWLASRGSLPEVVVVLLKLALATLVVMHIVNRQYASLIGLAAPMMWLAAAPGSRHVRGGLLRPLMSVLGTVQVLYVYPVAGWQTAFVSVLFVAAAALCVWDTLPSLAIVAPPLVRQFAPATVVTLIVLLTITSADAAYSSFRSREPLGLQGAAHLRLEPDLTKALRRLRDEAKSCSMLVSLPGLPSFNLLSGRPMPTGVGGGPWMLVLDNAMQMAAVHEVEAQPHPCAIYYPEAEKSWLLRLEPPPPGPLVRYIVNNLQFQFEVDGYRFLAKRNPAAAR